MSETTIKVATLVRRLNGYSGHAALYRVDPPMTGEDGVSSEYVVVSATNVMFSGPETYIFLANEQGEVIDWGELSGSFRGGLDHDAALNGAGYEVVLGD